MHRAINLYIDIMPSIVVELTIDAIVAATNAIRCVNDWLGDVLGRPTYN